MSGKLLIAHRGASAIRPEQTLPAFEAAVALGADYVELDLQVTSDGALICLHDRTLDRTTNAADVFPDRRRGAPGATGAERGWFVHDFTLAELRRLDAGAWFDRRFAGARLATLGEALAAVDGRAALCIELKDPEVYDSMGVDMLALCAAELKSTAVGGPRPHIVQSFHAPTIRRAAGLLPRELRKTVLIEPADAPEWLEPGTLESAATYATGIGPAKAILGHHPELVRRAHAAGLTVTPWTFRTRDCRGFANVRAEMAHYLDVLDVDGVITDEPEQWPR